ncbi:MAG: type I-MYXAN CRISPR-associated protein Cas6/Cmx6 [Nostocales cyanobacterium 94392]|nr:type I-MYXAN CRISPR-associated protein Cas6/Cmx6 [Nostocales cyanobacterium 94392]
MNNFIDLSFPVYGTELYADHNHRLLAGISQKFPTLHDLKELSINTITGIPDRKGKIRLTRNSKLYLRLPVEAIAHVYMLAGEKLEIGEYTIELGNPELQTLKPIDTLRARLVTIKGYQEPEEFLIAAERQLQALGISANIGIPANDKREPKRLTLKIQKYTIVGFSVVVSDLNPDDSIKLQIHGLGGKRRLGCGVFYPNIPISRALKGNINERETVS